MGIEFYEIKVKGHLESDWSEWFDGMVVTNVEDGQAVLSGLLQDQSALHGVLIKIRDLGLTLVSVRQIESTQQDPEPTPHGSA